jgi:hypothetical protein
LPCKRKQNFKKCDECGKVTIINKNKKTKKSLCGSCSLYTSPLSLFKKFHNGAAKRKIEFDITFEDFCNIVENPCFYCGSTYRIGIDRKNNNIGYKKYNCVPCCPTCNFMKGKFEIDDFICKIASIYENLIEK